MIELTKAPCSIESVTFARSKPKGANDAGGGVKKLALWVGADEPDMFSRCVSLFAGAIDEHTLQRVAADNGPGFELRSKRKLGVCIVKIHAPDGSVLFESPIAKVERPRLVIGKEAKTAWLVLSVEMALPRAALPVVDDYFKADTLLSMAQSQTDLEDAATAKAAQLAAEPQQVEWVPRA